MRVLILLLSLVVASCSRSSTLEPTVSAALEETFRLRVGQEAVFEGEPLRVRFDGVPEDSRCPSDVVCVWEGNARVSLSLRGTGGTPQGFDLNTALEPRGVTLASYRLELVGVEPVPVSDRAIAPDGYRIELRVTRAP